jgi:hypothetical protein
MGRWGDRLIKDNARHRTQWRDVDECDPLQSGETLLGTQPILGTGLQWHAVLAWKKLTQVARTDIVEAPLLIYIM